MPLYQLHVAIALIISAGCSFLIHLTTGPTEGKIKLPTFIQDGEEQLENDPFDVAKPEDIIDGEPLNENAFWAKVCVSSFLPSLNS